MPTFAYKAISSTGSNLSGTIEAESAQMARQQLAGQGLIPASVTAAGKSKEEAAAGSLQERLAKVKVTDLILFTKQFRTMLRAGVSILTLLQILEDQTENPKLRRVIHTMAGAIKSGRSLYEAFRGHNKVFSGLYCSMVKAGETSGALPEVLDRLVYLLEHEHKIRSDIKSAVRYPIMVISFLGIAFFVLLNFVIPKFIKVFTSAGLDLPLPTLICMKLNIFFSLYWYLVLGGAILLFFAVGYYVKTEQGQLVWDSSLMRIPIIGVLLVKTSMSRFASIFSLLQSSGVSVLESMNVLSGTIGNAAIAREFDRVKDMLREGRGISGPLRSAKYFTPMVVNMVAIGEETGNLDEMLREVSSHYDDEVEYAVKALSEAIGPILIAGLAGVVGFFALAIFLPMWDLTKMVK